MVGAALTLRPTPHRFRVRGNDTWCGFDALFLPIMLGEWAEVASTCPVTGTEIRLTTRTRSSCCDYASAAELLLTVIDRPLQVVTPGGISP